MKDDSGSYAVFTEQGSSASQMTAAKVMDIISRLPGCDGQAADAVSVYTQVKMEDAPKLLKIPKSECPDIWIRLPRHKCPKSWSSMEDPVVSLERNLYGHPLAGLLWERQFEKILLKYGWEKGSNWECLFVHREKGLFLSVGGRARSTGKSIDELKKATPCNRCGAIGHWEEDCTQLVRSRKKRSPAKCKGKSRRFRRGKSDVNRTSNYRLWRSTMMVRKPKRHM